MGYFRRDASSAIVVHVVWARGAASELRAIRAYIAEFSPLAAQRFAARLVSTARSLETSPDRGRPIIAKRQRVNVLARRRRLVSCRAPEPRICWKAPL